MPSICIDVGGRRQLALFMVELAGNAKFYGAPRGLRRSLVGLVRHVVWCPRAEAAAVTGLKR